MSVSAFDGKALDDGHRLERLSSLVDWTKKHGKSFFGYKNHVNVDRRHKLTRRYAVTGLATAAEPAGPEIP